MAGIATMAGGKFAPISLLIVAIVLYLFRGTTCHCVHHMKMMKKKKKRKMMEEED